MPSIDDIYEVLRTQRRGGWGGARFAWRLKGWGNEIASWRRKALIPEPPAVTLEIGCGNGAVSALLARRGYSVTGVDISINAIEWARDDFRRRGLCGDFVVRDVTSGLADFDSASFDLVVDGNCLHCICDLDARAQTLTGVRRLLRRHGRFVVSSMCGDPRSLEPSDVFDRERRVVIRDARPHRFLATVDGLTSELAAAGFEVDSVRLQSNSWWDHVWLLARSRS